MHWELTVPECILGLCFSYRSQLVVEIVRLSAENSSLLGNLAPEVFDEKIHPEFLSAFVNDERHTMFLAVERECVVGMASAVEYFHPDKAPQLWINEVGVASTHRRRGIGRQLVLAMIAEAEERKCTYAWLGTEDDNDSGKACFSSVPDVEKPQPFLLYEWDLED